MPRQLTYRVFLAITLLSAVGCGLFSDTDPDSSLLPPRGTGGLFGASIAISGDDIMVGAPYEGDGRAYIFRNTESRWILDYELGRDGSTRYGSDVAISGRRAAVSTFLSGPRDVEILTRDDTGTWHADTIISAHRGISQNHQLGRPLIINQDRLITHITYTVPPGSPYPVATWSYRNGVWEETGIVAPPDSSTTPFFGAMSALCGERLYVSARGNNDIAGAVYAYETAGDDWQFISRSPRYPDGGGAGYGWRSMACDGNHVIVGAPGESYEMNGRSLYRAGAAYLYELSGTDWTVRRLVPSDPNVEDGFGTSVTITEHWIGVSSYQSNYRGGAVYMFRRMADEVVEVNKLTEMPPVRNHFFGGHITLADDMLAVGATGHNRERGAVFLFRLSGDNWSPY